ncbi:MAG TPA: CotH kinase family protein [Bacteroidales bacterium]|nr:CotH kinase family protein [Bacteroidales bacterium]HSA43711.1 CotH kinase family protein [Bacteroidales bacterium]
MTTVFGHGNHAMAQMDFYSPEQVHEVRIYFHDQHWAHLLDSLIEAGQGRITGDVLIDGHLYKDAGIRYKGYSSWNPGSAKNPFNIELDYKINNRNHEGFTKLKLSNVIHDPSFVREVLAYHIARKYMPASRAGFANVYVNDTLAGLYTNVESVDKGFIGRHFPSNDNCFFKGSPAQLQYPFGQNANLSYRGSDTSAYLPYYELESDTGWKSIVHLTDILNNDPDQIGTVLNVDQTLWMHAFNYVTLNLDSYIGYAQNYYMYQDDLGLFNPIPWDLNMSFGSFRNSDGSNHYLGLSMDELIVLDPLQHLSFSVSPRPLMSRLFKNDTLRKMYLAHIRTIAEENFVNGEYYRLAAQWQDIADSYVMADSNKFYSYADFLLNLDTTVGGSGGLTAYPGIKSLMEARIAYLASYPGYQGAPVISDVTHDPQLPLRGQECLFNVRAPGAGVLTLFLRQSSREVFTPLEMFDDGLHQDELPGDGIFGVSVTVTGVVLQYYCYAENDSAGSFSPARAAFEFYNLQSRLVPGDVVINEIKAPACDVSEGAVRPLAWLEIFNNTRETVSLKGQWLSDSPDNPFQWPFPDTLMLAHAYLVLQPLEFQTGTEITADISLPAEGGQIRVNSESGTLIDSVIYGLQSPGLSTGRYPNGYGPFVKMQPSKGLRNFIPVYHSAGIRLYPNPAQNLMYIEYDGHPGVGEVNIFDAQGMLIRTLSLTGSGVAGRQTRMIDVSGLSRGVYLLTLNTLTSSHQSKFVLL